MRNNYLQNPHILRLYKCTFCLYIHVMAEQNNTAGAGAVAFVFEALGKIVNEVQFGPYKRKVKNYFDEALTG